MNPLKLSSILAVLVLSGCSWTGNIGSDFYVPEPTKQKIDAKIGLSERHTPARVRYGMSVDYSLGIDEYRNVLRKELSQRFTEVVDIGKKGMCDDCILIAEPRVKLVIDQSRDLYWGRLHIDFYEKSGDLFTSIDVETSGNATPTANLRNQSLATGATLGLLAAPTIDNYGEFLIVIGEQAIGELVWEAGRSISASKDLGAKSIALLDPTKRQKLDADAKIASMELESARHVASVCTNKAVKSLDDDISSVELIAVESGKQCRGELLAFANAICKKDHLSTRECRDIQDIVTSRQYMVDTITRQVLSNRNLKKRHAAPTTIIVPLTIPKAVPVPVPIPVPENRLKKMPTKPKQPTEVHL